MTRIALLALAICVGITTQHANAHDNQSSITIQGDQRCITSNGTPNHDIGQFPNRGNPHTFQAQTVSVCVDANPQKTGTTVDRTNASGITVTGIMIRPGTADYYDASSPRGFSRDRSSGWNLEAMGAGNLGLDAENAHVDNRGLYHYHAISASLDATISGSLIGYAADGFEIHYVGDQAVSGWTLKSGSRSSPPGGAHDGTYVQDWTFTGSGNLDECNGATIDGRYVYFATDTYPFFPRCFKGTVSQDFLGRP